MRPLAALLCLALASPVAAAPLCPRLAPADAKALGQKQLEARVCLYRKVTKDMLAAQEPNAAGACMDAALGAEQLYQERFGRKTGCWPDPPPKP